jgi:hypothetical protein
MTTYVMSEWFDLPFKNNGYNSFVTDNYDQTKAAIYAINSHDPLTARVVELEAELNKVSKAYAMVLDHTTGGELSKPYFDYEMVCKTIDNRYSLNEEENIKEVLESCSPEITNRVAKLNSVINEIRSIVTDVQDGFNITGSDAEILDVLNKLESE